MVLKIQKVLNKAILYHLLPLQISLKGGSVCSRPMVFLDQDQHLLGEYFYNSRWLVLVDKRKFFGRYPQWQWSPLPSIKWSWFHLVYRYWKTYAIKKVTILDTEVDSPASKHQQPCSVSERAQNPRSADHIPLPFSQKPYLGQMIQYLWVVASYKTRLDQMISKVPSSSIALWLTPLCKH